MIRRRTVIAIAACLSPAVSIVAAAAPRQAAPAPPGPARSDYTLGADDRVRVIVYGEEQLSGEYGVTATGEIAFPLIGNVAAAGRTTTELQEAIRARLAAGYIRQPRVSVEVIDYRPFYILGEVAKPGKYPYSNGMTVEQAIATAGGYTYRASTKRIFVKHGGESAEHPVSLRGGEAVPVRPGDTLRVAERFF